MLSAWRTAIAIGFGAFALGGCAATSGVSDLLTQGALQKSRSAVSVLKAQILGHGCSGGTLTIGVKKDQAFVPVQTVQTAPTAPAAGTDVMQVELPAGEYHILNVACGVQSGRTVTTVSLGNKEGGGLFGIGGQYKRSFASFEVRAGEIVNIGSLTVMSGPGGLAHLSVTDLPSAAVDRLRKDKPNLVKQMTTRLMTVVRAPRSPDETRKLCETFEQLRSILPSLAAAPPPECGSGATAATAGKQR